MKSYSYPASSVATLNIDLNAIIHNYETLKSQSKSAKCAAVVKANAYGIGAAEVAKTLAQNTDCKEFFVANLSEAIELRQEIKDGNIYVFNGITEDQIDYYLENNITPILNDLTQIEMWNGKKEPCAIHFDTGINRLGLSESETDQYLNGNYDLNLNLILSHFIRSQESEHIENKTQLEKFKKIRNEFPDQQASLCNSAGIYLGDEYHFDLLRPGIMLYGGNPGLPALPAGIKSVFELKAKILQIRELNLGESVGYNSTWTAKEKSRIALINVGYADGYLKCFDNIGKVFVAGQIAPVIGLVSMDMTAIDLSSPVFDKIQVQEEVEILGKNITLEMTDELSTLGQYELLTGLGARYKRNYK